MKNEPIDAKSASRGVSSDMSPEAVSRRLQICSDLSDACRELGKAQLVAAVESDSSDPAERDVVEEQTTCPADANASGSA